MRAARPGKTLLPQALAVFIATAGYCLPLTQQAWAATDDAKDAKTTEEAAAEAPKLPPNQLDPKELKSLKTPFSVASSESQESAPADSLNSLKLTSDRPSYGRPKQLDLTQRLIAQHFLYLPGTMVLGKTAEFSIKGKPGTWAALAMADKDTGAKPIMGHKIRLGPDRKVVAVGKIPDSGLLSLDIDTPIEGDLVGQLLYFEAAAWSKPDMSDTEILSVVPSQTQPDADNGVIIAAERSDKKRGMRIVPDTRGSMTSRIESSKTTSESGNP
ncbi:MAG TPA: hypothetical protein V6C81_02085 [Planktothrix sp.]|jgi:hypothetical protein